MANASQVYNELKNLSERHATLRKKFGEFFGATGYLASSKSKIVGVTLDDHLEEGYFNVGFCGHTFQFRFSPVLDREGASRGAVSCFAADPADLSKQRLVSTFTFSGAGVADVEQPEDIRDQITVNDEIGASYLVCYCIARGLAQWDPDR